MELGLDLALVLGSAALGAPTVSNGLVIANNANTTVTAPSVLAAGYRVTRTTGGGAWDASANSNTSVAGGTALIHRVAGSFMAGLSRTGTPDASNGFADIYGVWNDGVTTYVIDGFGNTDAGRAAQPYMWIIHNSGASTITIYHNASNNFGTATLIGTLTGANGVGSGAYFFDSSLNTAATAFEVIYQ